MTETPKTYYPQWTICYAMLGEDFSYISLDLGYLRLLPISDKGNTVRITVALTAPQEDGSPSDDEATVLEKLGHALNEAVDTMIDTCYIGFIASAKLCGFYFCTRPSSIPKQIIDETMREFPEYQCALDVIEEDNWQIFTECLYPAFQKHELIQHSSVVTQLEKGGDPLTKPRLVDHWCYFRTESDRACFAEEIGKEGFHIEDYSETHQFDEWPFGVRFSRVDLVDRQNLFKYTTRIWNLAYQYYGKYDGWETSVEKE